MAHLIQLMPVVHRDTLFVLLQFLAVVARNSNGLTCTESGQIMSIGNKMDSTNLATVISPNILHCNVPGQETTESEVEDRIDVINVIR